MSRRFSGNAARVLVDQVPHFGRYYYHWPGNVRELENLIERGVVLSSGPALDLDAHLLDLPPNAEIAASASIGVAPPRAESNPAGEATPSALEEVERRHIREVLERTRWVIEGAQGAALLLGLTPSTLRSRMKRLGIRRESRREAAS